MKFRALIPVVAIAAATLMPTAADAQEGCVGVPGTPAYACIGIHPENAPGVETGPGSTVTVPSACYFLGCTSPVPVPVPGVGLTSGGGDVVTVTPGDGEGGGELDRVGEIVEALPRVLENVGERVDEVTGGLQSEIDGATYTVRDLIERLGEVDWDEVINRLLPDVPPIY